MRRRRVVWRRYGAAIEEESERRHARALPGPVPVKEDNVPKRGLYGIGEMAIVVNEALWKTDEVTGLAECVTERVVLCATRGRHAPRNTVQTGAAIGEVVYRHGARSTHEE